MKTKLPVSISMFIFLSFFNLEVFSQTQNDYSSDKSLLIQSKVIRLIIVNTINNNSDEAIILFNPNAGYGFNSWDSEKMMNTNPSVPQIWTKEGTVNLVINSLPSFSDGMSLVLYQTTQMSVQHKISSILDDFDQVTQLLLEDLETGYFHDIRTGDYFFQADSLVNYTRFVLHFFDPVTTEIANNSINDNEMSIFVHDNMLYVSSINPSVVEVFNVTGLLVKSDFINGNSRTIGLNSGIYIVRLSDKQNVKVTKIVIQ